MTNQSKLISSLIKIAQKAGDAIMDIYENEDFGVEMKGDNSPLTKADKASNDKICAGLEQLEVQYPIISEENKMISYEDRKLYNRYWLVDPLDGTKEFIKRNGEFTVNIALIEQGFPVIGIVYAPVLGEMYWAEKEKGAHLIKGGISNPIHANKFSKSDTGLRVVCSRSHLNEETQQFIDALKTPEKVSKGSSLKFLMLANGEAELYPRIAPTMEWDTAAAQCVLEQAGGRVVQFDNGERVTYNKENLLNPFFVASANEIN